MGKKVFIPKKKVKYILSNDITILLYPFHSNSHIQKDKFATVDIYGKIDKENNLIVKHEVSSFPYEGNEHIWSQSSKYDVIDYFTITSQVFPDIVSTKIRCPNDLKELDPDGELYLITENDIRNNPSFRCFIFASDYKFFSKPNVPVRTNRFVKKKDGEVEKFEEYSRSKIQHEIDKWNNAQKLKHLFDKKIGDFVPIEYTLKAGDRVELEDVELSGSRNPFSSSKHKFSGLLINGETLKIPISELDKFELEEVPTVKKESKKKN